MKILDERYQDWVSSKDVMDSCGISRATLNNYIKLGIIQKPVVLKPRKGMEGTKKIGYFPPTVLDRISKVKQLKQEGNSVINIVKKLKEKKVQKTQENVIAERIEADKTPVLNSDVKAADKTYLDANQKVTISIDDIK